MKFVLFISLISLSALTFAQDGSTKIQKVCGNYDSNAGSIFFISNNKIILSLNEKLSKQFRSKVEDPEVGTRYCVKMIVNENLAPVKILEAYTNEEIVAKRMKDQETTIKKESREDISKENRKDLSYQVTIGTGFNYFMAVDELALSKFIDSNQQITLIAGVGSNRTDAQTNFTLQYKNFTSNSFYIAPEIYYVNYTDKESLFRFLSTEYDDRRLSALGFSFKIGNQWQWDNFTIGCDWVGIGQNLVRFKDDFNNNRKSTASLLNFYLGVSW